MSIFRRARRPEQHLIDPVDSFAALLAQLGIDDPNTVDHVVTKYSQRISSFPWCEVFPKRGPGRMFGCYDEPAGRWEEVPWP